MCSSTVHIARLRNTYFVIVTCQTHKYGYGERAAATIVCKMLSAVM